MKTNAMTFSTKDIQSFLNMDFTLNFFDTTEVLELFDMILYSKDGIIQCKSLILFKKLILLRSLTNINVYKNILNKLITKKSSLELNLEQLRNTIKKSVSEINIKRDKKISEMHTVAQELKNINLFDKFEEMHTYEVSVEARIKAKREDN